MGGVLPRQQESHIAIAFEQKRRSPEGQKLGTEAASDKGAQGKAKEEECPHSCKAALHKVWWQKGKEPKTLKGLEKEPVHVESALHISI